MLIGQWKIGLLWYSDGFIFGLKVYPEVGGGYSGAHSPSVNIPEEVCKRITKNAQLKVEINEFLHLFHLNS